MSAIMAVITILSLQICGADNTTIKENMQVEKPQRSQSTEKTVFRKVPTRWVKITKKSN